MDTCMMVNMIMDRHEHDEQYDHGAFTLILNEFQDREISTYLDPNVSVTPMAESHRSMGDTVYF